MKLVKPDLTKKTYSRNFNIWRETSILMVGAHSRFRDVYSLLIENWPNASIVFNESELRKEIKSNPPIVAIVFADNSDMSCFDLLRMDLANAKAKLVVKFESQGHLDGFEFRRKLTLSNASLCLLPNDIYIATEQLSDLLLDLAQIGVGDSDTDMMTVRSAFQGFVDGMRSAGHEWSQSKSVLFEKAAKYLLSLYALDFRTLQAANVLIESFDYWKTPFSKNPEVEQAYTNLFSRINSSAVNFKLVTDVAIFVRDFVRNGNFPSEALWESKLAEMHPGPRSEKLFRSQYSLLKQVLTSSGYEVEKKDVGLNQKGLSIDEHAS